jgi:sterol desaturase/sphingolipid hydroxylase (fatty acid hydroxylase superfamily)
MIGVLSVQGSAAMRSSYRDQEMPRATMSPMPGWLSACLVAGTFLTLAFLERRRPLRRAVEPVLQRTGRNLAIAGLGALAIQLAEMPIVGRVSAAVERRRWGVLKRLRLPVWLEMCVAVLLMDYTLYVWHVLTHRVPGLWRFHAVHHIDLDLDASTAVRFHFGELVLSTPWRVAQLALIGTSPLALSIWQTGLLMSILFHHSNVELPLAVERRLSRVFVTPRMHGIHHSVVHDETDSNWSSGLTLWDWMHGTLKLNVPQLEITIGVPAFRRPDDVTLPKMVELPFKEQPSHWVLPEGNEPFRSASAIPPTHLLS